MHKKLRVGLLLDDTLDVPDGVQQYVLTLGEWLSNNQHKVYYLVGSTKRNDINNIYSLAKNIKVSFNGNSMRIPYYASKKDISITLANLNLDVLHVQMPYSPLFAGKVINAVMRETNVVATFHIAPASKYVTYASKALALFTKKSLSRFNNFISVSSAAQQFSKETFNINSVVIPNAINSTKFVSLPKYNKKLHIVYLGRLVSRKGVIWLLKALKELNNLETQEYTVSIAGKGPLLKNLSDFTKANNMHNVRFLGYVSENDKAILMSSADIAVFPSTGGESFGIVLLEAMASGARVIVGGDNTGYRSVLKDYPSQLVNPKDTKKFASLLNYYLNNKSARDKAFKWNQQHFLKYDINTVGEDILKIYYKHKQ